MAMPTQKIELRQIYPLPPDFLQALGAVVAHFEHSYGLMGLTIARTTHLTYAEAMGKLHQAWDRKEVKRQVKADFRAAVIRDLPIQSARDKAAAFDHLLDQWIKLGARRDEVTHCFWSVGDGDDGVAGTRKGTLLTSEAATPYTIADLEDLVADLQQFVIQLDRMTSPELVRGPQEALDKIPVRFQPGKYKPDPMLVVESSAAATYPADVGKTLRTILSHRTSD